MENHQLQKTSKSQSLSLQNLPEWIKSEQEAKVYNACLAVKVKDFEPFDIGDLAKFLTKWRIDLGIIDELTHEELGNNIQFLQENYPDITLPKLNLAKNAVLTGVVKSNPAPYGRLSPLYISTVINAYLKYEGDEMSKILKRKHQIEQKQDIVEPTEAEKKQKQLDFYKYFSVQVAESTRFIPMLESLWNLSVRMGWVSEAMVEDLCIIERAEKLFKQKLSPFEQFGADREFERIQEKYCRFIILQDYFRANKVDFDKLPIEMI